jgi:two-component system, NtrC family, sensor histidine kinase HydH
MNGTAILTKRRGRKAQNLFGAQDFAWLLFVAALIVTTPETNYNATILLLLIGAFQIAEPRWKLFSSQRGQRASLVLKLVLSYLLIGYTHGITSSYYPIFLIPVVSAATTLEFPGVILVTAIAFIAYPSFLLFVPRDRLQDFLLPEDLRLITLRVCFYPIVAFLVFQQAKAKRDEMKRTREAAERLAESNRNLRLAEASLRRSERLAALGQLTAGLAHELRNPLGTIKASAEMLTKETAQSRPEVMSEMAGFIASEVDRVNGLISRFLDFARPLEIRPVQADLRDVLDRVVLQQSELARARNVMISVHVSSICFLFDPGLLELAISNLVQNAIQASAPGQEVALDAEVYGDFVAISVTDHGEGIQPQHLESIFNPFFTTKPHGVGLGLAIVAKIVDEHGGKISVASTPARGTTFSMKLPVEPQA